MEALQTKLPHLHPENTAEPTRPHDQGIEVRFDVPLVARLALKEKQIQQTVRPIISVHKWFARRPGTLFRALLLSEFSDEPLETGFFRSHHLDGLRIADPFMGGGTPLFEANRLGCEVAGWDVNPMAYWIVRQELTHLDLTGYLSAARDIEATVRQELGHLYRTSCLSCHSEVPVKYFVWVKVAPCEHCGGDLDLFPGYLLAADQRHPRNVLICAWCGDLTETADRNAPGGCSGCGAALSLDGPAGRGRCDCHRCGQVTTYPAAGGGPPHHRLVAVFPLPDGDDPACAEASTRSPRDLTGNQTLDRGLEHCVAGLSRIYSHLARALVPGRPFVFTDHHNSLDAYHPVAVALLDAGLVCTASLPC